MEAWEERLRIGHLGSDNLEPVFHQKGEPDTDSGEKCEPHAYGVGLIVGDEDEADEAESDRSCIEDESEDWTCGLVGVHIDIKGNVRNRRMRERSGYLQARGRSRGRSIR